MESASLYRRFFAFLFDWVLINIMYVMMLLSGIVAYNVRGGIADITVLEELGITFLFRLWMFIFVSYHAFFSYNGGQTPAKMLFKIKVSSLNGGALTPLQAVIRSVAYFFSSFMFLGFIMAIFVRKKRCLHDFIGRSIVLEVCGTFNPAPDGPVEYARRFL